MQQELMNILHANGEKVRILQNPDDLDSQRSFQEISQNAGIAIISQANFASPDKTDKEIFLRNMSTIFGGYIRLIPHIGVFLTASNKDVLSYNHVLNTRDDLETALGIPFYDIVIENENARVKNNKTY